MIVLKKYTSFLICSHNLSSLVQTWCFVNPLSPVAMGGKHKQFEPDSMDKLQESSKAYKFFCHAGWHHYFWRLQGYDLAIAEEFSRAFVQDNVTIRGITFLLTVQTMATVTNFPQIKELHFPTTNTRVTKLKHGKRNFLQRNESMEIIKGKGAQCKTLPSPWDAVAQFIGQYITYEGHFNFIHAHHLQLMLHLRLGHLINHPYYLYHSLKQAVINLGKAMRIIWHIMVSKAF